MWFVARQQRSATRPGLPQRRAPPQGSAAGALPRAAGSPAAGTAHRAATAAANRSSAHLQHSQPAAPPRTRRQCFPFESGHPGVSPSNSACEHVRSEEDQLGQRDPLQRPVRLTPQCRPDVRHRAHLPRAMGVEVEERREMVPKMADVSAFPNLRRVVDEVRFGTALQSYGAGEWERCVAPAFRPGLGLRTAGHEGQMVPCQAIERIRKDCFVAWNNRVFAAVHVDASESRSGFRSSRCHV